MGRLPVDSVARSVTALARGQCPNLKSPSTHNETTRHEKGEDGTNKYHAIRKAVIFRHLELRRRGLLSWIGV